MKSNKKPLFLITILVFIICIFLAHTLSAGWYIDKDGNRVEIDARATGAFGGTTEAPLDYTRYVPAHERNLSHFEDMGRILAEEQPWHEKMFRQIKNTLHKISEL